VGRYKTTYTSEWIKSLRPDIEIDLFGEANPTSLDALTDYPDYLFDCTDRRVTQRELLAWCKRSKVKYVRVGYNGEHFTTDSTITGFHVPDAPDEHGYTIVPSYAPSALLPAILAVDGVCRLGRIPKIITTISQLIAEGEKL
jgi:hypothetical protein